MINHYVFTRIGYSRSGYVLMFTGSETDCFSWIARYYPDWVSNSESPEVKILRDL